MGHDEIYAFDNDIIFLLQQLGNPQVERAGDKWRISCPFPAHQETHPSFHFNRRVGTFYCFGCKEKGDLAQLALKLNLHYDKKQLAVDQELYDTTDPFYTILRDMEAADAQADAVVEAPTMLRPLPVGSRWRRLPYLLLDALGAKLWYDDTKRGGEIDRVWFPVTQLGELAGWFARVKSRAEHARHPDSKKIPKYRNNQHQCTWRLLFPYDYVWKHFGPHHVVLVEGQVDALALIAEGIPALAIFGTGNWTDHKSALLSAAGVTHVIVAMDGDKSGRKLQSELVPALRETFRRVDDFSCPDDEDPASMPASYRRRLARLL